VNNERIFKPSKPDKTAVKFWFWTSRRGLYVEYVDGFKCKSEWTLKEILSADHLKGDGLPAIELYK
jgi:hypothetical protein